MDGAKLRSAKNPVARLYDHDETRRRGTRRDPKACSVIRVTSREERRRHTSPGTGVVSSEPDMFDIGLQELILIFVIALLVFGPKNLPQLGRSLGRAMREFKKASAEFESTIRTSLQIDEIDPPPSPTPHPAPLETPTPAAEAAVPDSTL